jgi:SOS-response transcriptional repressor LexA
MSDRNDETEKEDRMLRGRRREVLKFVCEYLNEHGFAPTIREIMEGTALKSTSVVKYHLDVLQAKSYLVLLPAKARAITVTQKAFEELGLPARISAVTVRVVEVPAAPKRRRSSSPAGVESDEDEKARLHHEIIRLQRDKRGLMQEIRRLEVMAGLVSQPVAG